MATTSYTGEVSMATSDFVATMDESALPPLHVTPEDGAEGGEQLSEIDRRLREKVKREKERERKRKLETDKLETLEASSAKSLCSRPEVADQKLVVPSSDGDGPVVKTSVRYTEGKLNMVVEKIRNFTFMNQPVKEKILCILLENVIFTYFFKFCKIIWSFFLILHVLSYHSNGLCFQTLCLWSTMRWSLCGTRT